MVRQYKKGEILELSEHFLLREFDCKCQYPECKITLLDDDLIDSLEMLRPEIGIAIILSGFRCPRHNKEIGGSDHSQHMLGKAADVATKRLKPEAVAARAENIFLFNNGGIGIYPTFTHLDVRGQKARWRIPA